MDKRVVFAVAGSGKTTSILDRVENDSKYLIITYTDNNTQHLKSKIIQKLGKIPDGVRVYSYFTFLYSFCYRPLCDYEIKCKGINFTQPIPKYAQITKKNTWDHYFDKNRRLFSSRIAKLLIEFNVIPEVLERIEAFFEAVFVDEIQDFAANDFNLVCQLAEANVDIKLVGDFFQHTFDTSRDGNTQKNLHNSFNTYCQKLSSAGYTVDLESLSHSYRCSPTICSFVENNIGISIKSHRDDTMELKLLEDQETIEQVFYNDSVVKLFYQNSNAYPGNTENWGNTKGLDHYRDVCVVLNPNSFKAYETGQLSSLAATTKNKLYVACTRAKGNLYFVSEKKLKSYKQ
jgi:superfamily I DNA/RNA helicase